MENKRLPFWLVTIHLIIFITFPNVGGLIGALLSVDKINNWYPNLEKPSWTPPTWLFSPMWVLLYCLMGVASYLVYRLGGGLNGRAKWCLLIYLVNLGLNWSWTPVFFNAQNIFAAFVLIIFVLITAIIEAAAFSFVSWIAGALILPYITWMAAATALNGWIYINN